jgi:hypothetical protein
MIGPLIRRHGLASGPAAILSPFFAATVLAFSCASAHATPTPARKPRVVELGETDLKAEIRKPLLDQLDSNDGIRALAPEIARAQFEAFERSLLQPEPPFTEIPPQGVQP